MMNFKSTLNKKQLILEQESLIELNLTLMEIKSYESIERLVLVKSPFQQ